MSRSVAGRRSWERAGPLAGFALLSFLLYGRILPEAWANDDLLILQQVASRSPLELVASRDAWREFAPLYFFPVQLWSLKLDLAVWGANPLPFRARQLLELGLAAYLLFRLLEPRAGRVPALWAGALFLGGATNAVLAQQLMCRHYVDGVLLSLLALTALEKSSSSSARRGLLVLAAALYLLAVLCKEVFAPLPIVAWLCFRSLRRDVSFYASTGAALALAAAYRFAMVGAVPRVYRPDIWTAEALAQNARFLVTSAGRVLFEMNGAFQAVTLVVLSVPFVVAGIARPRLLVAAAVCLLAAATPALPVADVLGARHLVGVWMLLVAGAAIGLAHLVRGPRLPAVAVAAAALWCVVVGNRVRWVSCLEEARLYTAICQFLFRDGQPGDYLQLQGALARTGYAFGPAGWIRRHLGDGREVPALLAVQGAGACVPDLPAGGRYHQLVNGEVRHDVGFLPRTRRLCARRRPEAPFTAVARYHDGRLEWELGPHRGGGSYSVVVLGTDPDREVAAQMYEVPPTGAVWMLNGPTRQMLAFVFESSEGWFTTTAPKVLERKEGARVTWPAGPG